jgi:tRNA(fMet)-specific endonuclease VapC
MNRAALIDNDTISNVMRGHPIASKRFEDYFALFGRYTISMITRFEILRGLKVAKAKKRLQSFEQFCGENDVLPLTEAVVVRAAGIYADLYRQGKLIGDADILIAATALEHDMDLATNNTKHFENVIGLTLVNWLEPAT